ncbi:Uncharacterised protein [Streptococcus pneumoniae]|nr:Uncharacterised protein [Streptococcus pneumoniae]CEW22547.1 Uncharacterised protein [Streptococcus pneumoniae]CEY08184.1 Uncharacterised protein [Streptococcus pneumoniae]CGG99586.1 Uncharacterised protein [Streptococcus pneumoniae]CIP32578.1 Uncharacterised protein [Streptococcus pneumoniae]
MTRIGNILLFISNTHLWKKMKLNMNKSIASNGLEVPVY